MGIFDFIKDAPGAVGDGLSTAADHTVGRVWDETVGEWGDRDYEDHGGEASVNAARAQRDGVLSKYLAPKPDAPAMGPLGQRLFDARAAAQPEDTRPLTSMLAQDNLGDRLIAARAAAEDGPLADMLRESWTAQRISTRWDIINKKTQDHIQREFQGNLSKDFETLIDDQRDNGTIENWNGIAGSVVQLIENAKDKNGDIKEDEKSQDSYSFAMGILSQYQKELQGHVELEAPGWWEENYVHTDGPSAFNRKASGIAAPVFSALDAWSQDIIESIATAGRDPVTGEDVSDSLLSGDMWRGVGRGLKNLLPGVDANNYEGFDEDGDGRLSFREGIGADPGAWGDWGAIFDLTATIVTDPLTYVTFGSTRAGRVAEGAITRQAAKMGTQEAAQHAQAILAVIKKDGLHALTPLDKIQFERWALMDAMDAARSQGTGLTGKARTNYDKLVRKSGDRMSKLNADALKTLEGEIAEGRIGFAAADRAAGILDKSTKKVQRGGQAGIGFAGHTLLPYVDIPGVNKLMDSFRIGQKARPLGEVSDELVPDTDQLGLPRATAPEPVFGQALGAVDTPWGAGFADAAARQVDEAADPRVSKLFNDKADELAERMSRGEAPDPREMDAVASTVDTAASRGDEAFLMGTVPIMPENMYSHIIEMKPGIARRIAAAAPFAAVSKRLVPRAGMINRIGRTQARAFHTELRRAQGAAFAAQRDIKNRLQGKLGKSALEEFGGDAVKMSEFLNRAMASQAEMLVARTRFPVASTATGKLLNALEDVRRQIWDTLSKKDQDLFGHVDTYIPRVLSDNGRKILANLDDDTLARLMDESKELGRLARSVRNEPAFGTVRVGGLNNDPFTKMRTIAPYVQDLHEVNALVAEHLKKAGIKMDELFESNVLDAWGTRSEAAFRANIVGDMKRGMQNLVDDNGHKLIVTREEYLSLDSAAKMNLTEELTDVLGDQLYVHKDLAIEMAEVTEILLDPLKRDSLGKALNEVNGLWARYATLSPGFHARNTMGNVFNAMLAGVTNPIRFVDAQIMQKQHKAAQSIMGETGMSFERSLARHLGKLDEMNEAASRSGLNLDQYILDHMSEARVLKDMEHHKVIDGLFGDVFETDAAHVKEVTLKNVANPFTRTGANITHASRKLGNAIEHNARAAVYLDQIAKGVAPEAAAAHVRQYLFDYQDLTQWESGVRRSVSRFYTWMRKNTALQLDTLARTPGKVNNVQRIFDEGTALIFGDEDRESMLPPQWAQAAGMKVRANGNGIGIETPFYSAMNTVEDLMAVPVAIAMEAGWEPPASVEEAIGWHGLQDATQSALGLFSGLPKSVADAMYGQATGYDPFTGGALRYDTTPGWLKMASIVNPAMNRAARLEEDIKEGFSGMDWVHWLGGVQIYDKDRIDGSASSTLKFEMERLIREAKANGEPSAWESMDDLRREAKIDTVNRYMHIMAYGGGFGEDPEKLNEQLMGLVPKEVLELFGMDPDKRRHSSEYRPLDDDLSAERGLAEAISALENLMERPLTAPEKLQVLLMSAGVPYDSEVEELGVNPDKDYSDGGVFADSNAPEARDPLERLTALGSVIGLNVSQMQTIRPRLTEVDKLKEQARMSGALPGDIDNMVANYIIENMSRTDLATIFGPDVLSTHGWMGFDDRDAANAVNAGWQDAAVFSFLFQTFNDGRRPTQELINNTVIRMNMGKTDENILVQNGYLDFAGPSMKSSKNVQTKQEQSNDSLFQRDSILQGTTDGPWQGPLPEADARNEFSFGGAGLPIAD